MTTLHVDLGPTWRGGQTQVSLLLRGLQARGHQADLICIEDSPLARRCLAEGVAVHGVGKHSPRLQATFLLRRLLTQRRSEIVHAHDAHGLTAAWLARAHRRASVVASRRVVYPLQRNPLARARYHSARRILAVSHFVARSVTASGLTADRVEVVHDGVVLPPAQTPEIRRQARKRWGASEQEVLLGCVGVLLSSKGQEFLVRSVPPLRVEFPSCRLLLAGEGPCREQLGALARQLGVQKAVQFTGFLYELDQLYSALDIFLFPALSEGLSTSLLRAMAHGLPVVALEQEAAPEAIENERSGLLLSDREPQTIAAATTRLLRDRHYAQSLGAAARETIEQRFTADHMVESTLRVYKSLTPAGVPS